MRVWSHEDIRREPVAVDQLPTDPVETRAVVHIRMYGGRARGVTGGVPPADATGRADSVGADPPE